MKARLFAVIVVLIASASLSAQSNCQDCGTEGFSDYCFQDELFSSYCAMFKEGDPTFQLKVGKKVKKVPVTSNTEVKALLEIASNKKLKISARDILFIQTALNSWQIESRKLGYNYEDSGLGIKILKEGTGDSPEKGKQVTVHYTGWLLDGTKFDSSVDRGKPFKFTLGQGRVIKGWDEGVSKLKKGTKALLKIPSELGYGSRGAGGSIPPNSTLIFEIEVLD